MPVIGTQAQTVVSGQKTYTDAESYQRTPQFLKVEEQWAGAAPLTVLSKRMGNTIKVYDDNFFHMEEDHLPQTVEVDGSHASGVTSILLTSGHAKYVRARDFLYNPATRERLLITDVNTNTHTLTVVRAQGSSSAATIADNQRLQIMASSFASGSVAPTGLDDTPARFVNYLQIHKDAIEQDGRALKQQTYGNTTGRARNWDKMMDRCYQKIEKTILFGGLDAGTSTGVIATGGFTYWLSSCVTDFSGGFTELAFNQWLEELFRFNQSTELLLLVGSNFCAYLDSWGRDRLETRPGDQELGVNIQRYKSSFGSVKFVRHGMLNDSYDNSGYWAGLIFAVNLNHFKIAHFADRNMVIEKGKQTPDLDGVKDYILHDFGCYLSCEHKHGWGYGIPNPFTA